MKQGIDKGLETGFGIMHFVAQAIADGIAHTEGVVRQHTNVNKLTANEITEQRKETTAVRIEMTSLIATDMKNKMLAKLRRGNSTKNMRLVTEYQTFNRVNYDV
jgi:hypothetical protein